MATMSEDEARRLAEEYRSLAEAILDYEEAKSDALSEADQRSLGKAVDDLLDASSNLLGLANKLTLEDLGGTLERISGATARMKDAIQKLQSVKKVIGVATAAVALGGALVSGNPAAILGAVDDLATATS